MFAHSFFPAAYYPPGFFPPYGAGPPVYVPPEPGASRRPFDRHARRKAGPEDGDESLPPIVAAVASEELADAFARLAPEARARIEERLLGADGDEIQIEDAADREAQWAAIDRRLRLLIDDELLLLAIRI